MYIGRFKKKFDFIPLIFTRVRHSTSNNNTPVSLRAWL